MLPWKLVQLVEDHAEQIATRVIGEIHKNPKLVLTQRLPELELRQRAQDILKNLSHWLVPSKEEDLATYYEHLGRSRFHESIPLEEVVLAFLIVKEEMLDFVRDVGTEQPSAEPHAEEELEHWVGRFFDHVVYHLVRGYQEAMRQFPPHFRTLPTARQP
jgi:hypothetical protein